MASQMSEAIVEKTNVSIAISGRKETFVASGEMVKFDGFLKVYIESSDDDDTTAPEGLLPRLEKGDILNAENISASMRYTQHPPRFNEATLVKKLEELGIGRPSTYAPIISTIIAELKTQNDDIGNILSTMMEDTPKDCMGQSLKCHYTFTKKARMGSGMIKVTLESGYKFDEKPESYLESDRDGIFSPDTFPKVNEFFRELQSKKWARDDSPRQP